MTNEPFPDRHDDPPPGSNPQQVPPDLMQRLRDANDRFHRAKQQLDGMFERDQRLPGERNKVGEDLREAEAEVEQVTQEVNRVLKLPDPPPPAPPNPA